MTIVYVGSKEENLKIERKIITESIIGFFNSEDEA